LEVLVDRALRNHFLSSLSKLRILIADVEDFTQMMLSELLTAQGYETLAVGTVNDALHELESFAPHAVITDLNFGPGLNGAELLVRIHDEAPWIGLVILTTHASPELAVSFSKRIPKQAIYLVKSDLKSVEILVSAIESSLTKSDPATFSAKSDRNLLPISESQAEVLRLMSEGFTNAAIAEMRKTSLRATEGLIQRTFSALGITSESDHNPRVVAVRMWQQGKIIVK